MYQERMIPDNMWNEIKKEIPRKKSNFGRPEWSARQTMEGIIYIAKTGAQWKFLPKEFGCVSTVHGKFRKWVKNGVFDKIMKTALKSYLKNNHNRNLSWLSIDTGHSKAPLASWSGKNPTDRRKRGIKKSIITDFYGAILAIIAGPSNIHDSKFLVPTFEKLKEYVDMQGLGILAADSAFDSKKLKNYCKNNNFVLFASTNRRRKKNCKIIRPGRRWIVERSMGWLSWFRGIKICWTKTKDSFISFLQIAASVQLFKMRGVFV